MEYILRKMTITTLEKRVDLEDDGEELTPEHIRHRVNMTAELGGWDTNVETKQTVLIEINDSVLGSKRIGNWND